MVPSFVASPPLTDLLQESFGPALRACPFTGKSPRVPPQTGGVRGSVPWCAPQSFGPLDFLAFLRGFSPLFQNFRVSAGIKNPCFLEVCSCVLPPQTRKGLTVWDTPSDTPRLQGHFGGHSPKHSRCNSRLGVCQSFVLKFSFRGHGRECCGYTLWKHLSYVCGLYPRTPLGCVPEALVHTIKSYFEISAF